MKKSMAFICLLFTLAVGNAQMPIKEVGIAVDVNDVSEIFPKQELTDMELTVRLQWQGDKRPDSALYFQGKQVETALLSDWWPYYQIINSRGVINTKLRTMSISTDGLVNYTERLRVKIETAMDMHSFPFDRQLLKIQLTPFGQSGYQTHYNILSDEVKINTNAHLDEWDLIGANTQVMSAGNTPIYQVSLDYQRKSGFYLYKILIPLFVIIGLSNAIIWLPSQPAINRLTVVMTAMLTVVAFQWVIGSDMPMVSYITFLQAVLLFSFLLIGSKAVLIVAGEAYEGKNKLKIMRHARWIYPLALILGLAVMTLIWFE